MILKLFNTPKRRLFFVAIIPVAIYLLGVVVKKGGDALFAEGDIVEFGIGPYFALGLLSLILVFLIGVLVSGVITLCKWVVGGKEKD